MTASLYDLCGIGNALVDILVSVDDAFLAAHKITKGGMMLVDAAAAAALYRAAGAAVEMSSGGSAANTLAGFASLGGKGAFIGKIGQDQFGDAFSHDLKAQKIHFPTPRAPDLPTGSCLVLVTPDAQRSMNTCLGAAGEFGVKDLDADVIRNAAVTYLEGYLFDKPSARRAFRAAAQIAHQAGRKMALTLSDVFCVLRHHDELLELLRDEVDILFANENELLALYKTDSLEAALAQARQHVDIAVTTRGARGAVIVTGNKTYKIAAHPVDKIIDSTGAGDLYAAGFLYGLTQGKSLAEAGRIGAIAAAEIISHYGPRPQVDLAKLLANS